MKIEFQLGKRESSAKKTEARVQIKLEANFAKATKTAYDHGNGSDYSSANDDSNVKLQLNLFTVTYILYKTKEFCSSCI